MCHLPAWVRVLRVLRLARSARQMPHGQPACSALAGGLSNTNTVCFQQLQGLQRLCAAQSVARLQPQGPGAQVRLLQHVPLHHCQRLRARVLMDQ